MCIVVTAPLAMFTLSPHGCLSALQTLMLKASSFELTNLAQHWCSLLINHDCSLFEYTERRRYKLWVCSSRDLLAQDLLMIHQKLRHHVHNMYDQSMTLMSHLSLSLFGGRKVKILFSVNPERWCTSLSLLSSLGGMWLN